MQNSVVARREDGTCEVPESFPSMSIRAPVGNPSPAEGARARTRPLTSPVTCTVPLREPYIVTTQPLTEPNVAVPE